MNSSIKYDSIIVLGGGRNDKGLTPLSTIRLDKGWELFQQKRAPKIFALGGHYSTYMEDSKYYNDTGAELRRNYLLGKGNIKSEDIVLVADGRDTIYEAFASRKLAKEMQLKNILLVTSEKHTKRALYLFQRIFGKNIQVHGGKDTWAETGDVLLDAEEEAYFKLWKSVFDKLPDDIPDPESWEQWYQQNIENYQYHQKIHDEFHPPGSPESQAYTGRNKES